MSLPLKLFCAICGAANSPHDSHCSACYRPLQAATPPAKPQAKQLLRQRYHMLNRLGQGGMGSVYQAEDIELGKRLVAIKELSQRGLNQHEEYEAEEAFKREALLLAGLMHPNLPRIYDNFSESGRWYLVMDFIEGETLDDYLRSKGGKLPWSELFEIATQICTVLRYLHTRPTPIIFRDLKPLNIMVTPTRQIYLIDFGIARLFKPGQARDTVAFGSPGYAAPEQYGRTQTAPSADIYSLGAIIHQILTGRDPSTTPFSFARIPNITAELQALLDQMLVLDARQRIADAEVVKQTLQSIDTTIGKYKSSTLQIPALSAPPLYTPPAQRPVPVMPSMPSMTPFTLTDLAAPQTQPQVFIPTGPPPTLGKVIGIYQGHMDVVSSLAWSPDSTQIASASYDKTIQLWYVKNRQMKTFYRTHTGPSRETATVVWSPRGKLIASTSDNGVVQIWQTEPLQIKINYKEHTNSVRALAWSRDGRLLASVSQSTLHIWDPSNGQTLTRLEGTYGNILTIAWSPGGSRVALGYDTSVIQILKLHRQVATLQPSTVYMGHYQNENVTIVGTWPAHKVVWSPDGKYIASASADRTIQVWDTATGKCRFTYRGHTETIYTLDWSPNGASIASSSADGTIQIWNAQNGIRRYTHSNHNTTVYAIAWSPNGTYIASGAHSHIMVWQAK